MHFFNQKDANKVEKVLSTITENKEKVDYLRGYIGYVKSRGKPISFWREHCLIENERDL